jgi:hypothetical protein
MSSATLTSPPTATEKLVVDTDVASFVFKWHPEFAARYVAIMRGSELVVSFMTVAEMRQGALEANWGPRKCAVLETYLADFSVLHTDSLHIGTWTTWRYGQVAEHCGPAGSAELSFGSPFKIQGERQRVLEALHYLCGKPANFAFKTHNWQRS